MANGVDGEYSDGQREGIGKFPLSFARSLDGDRTRATESVYARRLYTPETDGGGGGSIRSAYKRIGGNGVSELAAS